MFYITSHYNLLASFTTRELVYRPNWQEHGGNKKLNGVTLNWYLGAHLFALQFKWNTHNEQKQFLWISINTNLSIPFAFSYQYVRK